jgi:hypothetical protein
LEYAMTVYPCVLGSNDFGGAAPATKCVTSPAPSLSTTANRANGDMASSGTSSAADTVVGFSTLNTRRNQTCQSPAAISG